MRHNIVRHTSDYCVRGDPAAGILALTYPRTVAAGGRDPQHCNQRKIAVQPQGGMTGLSGGGCPWVRASWCRSSACAPSASWTGPPATITVEAGVVMEAVQQAADAAELFFPLDIGGRGSCQIGGNVSTNAGGNRVLRFGMARDLVLGVEAVLADGTVIDALSKVIKNNTGYDLRQLFIGSEGTLGIITAVVLRLFPKPRSVCTGLCAVADYAGVLELLQRARSGFGSQTHGVRSDVAAVLPGRLPWTWAASHRLMLGHGAYVLIETMGLEPDADRQRYEAVIGEAMQAGSVKDAIIAQSQREADRAVGRARFARGMAEGRTLAATRLRRERADRRDRRAGGEIDAALKARWPELAALYFGHVADGNLHVSVRMAGHSVAGAGYRAGGLWRGRAATRVDLGRARHRLAEEGVPALVAQRRGDRPDAHDQAGHGPERHPESGQDLLTAAWHRAGACRAGICSSQKKRRESAAFFIPARGRRNRTK